MVIVLRVYEKQTLVNEALATGVSGFVLKKTAAWDLIPAIRYALQSRTYVSLTVR
jgi:DNA-binding NarL/FixJ family response regulator